MKTSTLTCLFGYHKFDEVWQRPKSFWTVNHTFTICSVCRRAGQLQSYPIIIIERETPRDFLIRIMPSGNFYKFFKRKPITDTSKYLSKQFFYWSGAFEFVDGRLRRKKERE